MSAYRKVKPHPNEKAERNQRILEYIKRNPNATMVEVGEVCGISATMVCRIKNRGDKVVDYRTS